MWINKASLAFGRVLVLGHVGRVWVCGFLQKIYAKAYGLWNSGWIVGKVLLLELRSVFLEDAQIIDVTEILIPDILTMPAGGT